MRGQGVGMRSRIEGDARPKRRGCAAETEGVGFWPRAGKEAAEAHGEPRNETNLLNDEPT